MFDKLLDSLGILTFGDQEADTLTIVRKGKERPWSSFDAG